MNNNIINDLFTGKDCPKTPIWFLRQAGRHIPEYFAIRSRAKNFIDFWSIDELVLIDGLAKAC